MKYDVADIDRDILETVELLNKLDGIETIFSCSGHPESLRSDGRYHGYVMFKAHNIDTLYTLVEKIHRPVRIDDGIPNYHWFQIRPTIFSINVGWHEKHGIRYTVSFNENDWDRQLKLIAIFNRWLNEILIDQCFEDLKQWSISKEEFIEAFGGMGKIMKDGFTNA
jgi:hypothetical protein